MTTSHPEPQVLIQQDAAVRTLTLNRPKALNSFTTSMHAELMAAQFFCRRVPQGDCARV